MQCVRCEKNLREETNRQTTTPTADKVVIPNNIYPKAIETINHLSLHYEFMNEKDLRTTLQQIHECSNQTILAVGQIEEY